MPPGGFFTVVNFRRFLFSQKMKQTRPKASEPPDTPLHGPAGWPERWGRGRPSPGPPGGPPGTSGERARSPGEEGRGGGHKYSDRGWAQAERSERGREQAELIEGEREVLREGGRGRQETRCLEQKSYNKDRDAAG